MSALVSEVLERVREPGTSRFSPVQISKLFDLQQQDLAALARVHRNTVRTHPESAKLQDAMRDVMRVLAVALEIQPDTHRAIYFLKNEPIAVFGHKPLFRLVAEGRTDAVVAYLESVASGFVG